MPYNKLELSNLGLEKDFVLFIKKYEQQYMSIYGSSSSNTDISSASDNVVSTKKKKKRLFDKFFFSMD